MCMHQSQALTQDQRTREARSSVTGFDYSVANVPFGTHKIPRLQSPSYRVDNVQALLSQEGHSSQLSSSPTRIKGFSWSPFILFGARPTISDAHPVHLGTRLQTLESVLHIDPDTGYVSIGLKDKVSYSDNPSPIRIYVRYPDGFSPNARAVLKSILLLPEFLGKLGVQLPKHNSGTVLQNGLKSWWWDRLNRP